MTSNLPAEHGGPGPGVGPTPGERGPHVPGQAVGQGPGGAAPQEAYVRLPRHLGRPVAGVLAHLWPPQVSVAIPDQLQATPRPVSVASGQAFLTAGFIRPVSGSLHLSDSLSLYCSSQLLTWGGPHNKVLYITHLRPQPHPLQDSRAANLREAARDQGGGQRSQTCGAVHQGGTPQVLHAAGVARFYTPQVLPGTAHCRFCQVLHTAGAIRYYKLQVRSGTAHCKCCQVLNTAGTTRYCTLQVRSGTSHCRCY